MDFGLIIIAYLFGSVSTAVIVAKLMHLEDPRTVGSKNPGATNVLRVGGKKAAAFTLAGDCVKGLIPVLIGLALGVSEEILAAIGLAAFLGHLYPVFFGFKGGKGVATAAGVLLAISWPVGLSVFLVWLLVVALTKISAVSALIAALFSPMLMWYITGSNALITMNIVIAVLLVWRHRNNIKNLVERSKGEKRPNNSG